MTENERLERAAQARFVLENPAYKGALEKIVSDIRALRLALGPRDSDGAVKLVMMEQSIERAKRLMEAYLQDGDAARRELEREVQPGPLGRINRAFRKGQIR